MVAMLAGIGVVVVATVVAIALGLGTEARHRAQNAADAAALAAAGNALAGEAGACERGRQLAVANGALLRTCSLTDAISDVTVTVDLPGLLRRFGPVQARARAGPATVGSSSG